jgi:hypothetical protein
MERTYQISDSAVPPFRLDVPLHDLLTHTKKGPPRPFAFCYASNTAGFAWR